LDKKDGNIRALLSDLGWAQTVENLDENNALIRLPNDNAYGAPERMVQVTTGTFSRAFKASKQNPGYFSDIYSLGMLICEILNRKLIWK
jgi:hypothetical protein